MDDHNTCFITVRCYAELNDYLPPDQRYKDFQLVFPTQPTLEQVLLTLGLNLNYVDLVIRNKTSITRLTLLANGDRISIYPTLESFDISSLEKLHPIPLRQPTYIADVHLGKLAKLLRLMGFDTLYFKSADYKYIIQCSLEEQRCILSKSDLYKSKPYVQRYFQITTQYPREQLREVFNRFDLWNCVHPFTRCLTCNTLLTKVEKHAVKQELIPQRVFSWCTEYQYCSNCVKYFWKGTHYERMINVVTHFLNTHLDGHL
ncbi:MAG: Mut7-C ubiquitin/RNAse domain-containing protein [Bacteroidetes bacterium]|nr:Mut7-C ubiquitin/RNAse domain-containing protein [Bacteroidota bacterium]